MMQLVCLLCGHKMSEWINEFKGCLVSRVDLLSRPSFKYGLESQIEVSMSSNTPLARRIIYAWAFEFGGI